jgi:hypothetical protein
MATLVAFSALTSPLLRDRAMAPDHSKSDIAAKDGSGSHGCRLPCDYRSNPEQADVAEALPKLFSVGWQSTVVPEPPPGNIQKYDLRRHIAHLERDLALATRPRGS